MAREDDQGRPSWYIRRRIIITTLLFCASCVIYILLFYPKTDSRVLETVIVSAFALGGGTIGSYVFGAAWTDIKIDSNNKTNRRETVVINEQNIDER